MEYTSALMIVGPTSVGKTTVAFEFARYIGIGEVINLDKLFLFKHFPISTGLIDTLKEKGVERHFYELLEPNEEIIPVRKYTEMVKIKAAEILSFGKLPIIEGGSTTYGPAVLDENLNTKFCHPVIGIRFSSAFNFTEKLYHRIDLALEAGLIDEVKKNLEAYKNSWIINDAIPVVPIVRYLNGRVSLEDAKKEIVERGLSYINHQMQVFERYKEIKWLEYEPDFLDQTIKKICSYIQEV